ncbi:MAG: LPS export ABC transporter ATP-binding protein [Gemmatales bacterium]
MSLLTVEGLEKTYGRRKVVNGVGFFVNQGEVVGLLGPNGAGKTTSFRMTTGMVKPDRGRVQFAEKEVTNWPMYQRARLGLGYLSQESSIFRKLTVEQNILAILEAMPGLRSLQGRKPSAEQRREIAHAKLEEFGLLRLKASVAQTLSGGEKRRLEIARCLATEPLLILLDEPFTGIDPITISEIQVIVRNLCKRGISILITDHNVRETLRITDRSYVITDGQVVAQGTPDEIVKNQTVIARYLGQNFVEDHQQRPASTDMMPQILPMNRSVAKQNIDSVLNHERIFELIEQLKGPEKVAAENELLSIGRPALSHLLEAMERRDLELRRMAFHLFAQIEPNAGDFDAYAPEAQRRSQIDRLRDRALRRAG